MKKRLFKILTALLAVLVLCVGAFSLLAGCRPRNQTLVVYNWGDYIDESVNGLFEQWYEETYGEKIYVDYRTFDTNESMYTDFSRNTAEYDLLCPSDYMIAKLIREGLVQKIDRDAITNWNTVDPSVIGLAYDPASEYSVPYTWGTLGILYDPSAVSLEKLQSEGYGIFWDSEFAHKVLMKDSVRDAIVAAVGYKYHDQLVALSPAERQAAMNGLINFTDSGLLDSTGAALTFEKELADIAAAFAELTSKGMVYEWEVDGGKDEIIKPNSKCVLNLCWSGDATYAIYEAEQAGKELAYFVPEEGSNVWVDAFVVSKDCARPEVAQAYMNFLLRPEIAFKNMDYIGYTSAVRKDVLRASDAYADFELKDFMSLPVMYPTPDQLAVCAPMLDFNTREDAINEMWNAASSNR